jgi:hypothetical protein
MMRPRCFPLARIGHEIDTGFVELARIASQAPFSRRSLKRRQHVSRLRGKPEESSTCPTSASSPGSPKPRAAVRGPGSATSSWRPAAARAARCRGSRCLRRGDAQALARPFHLAGRTRLGRRTLRAGEPMTLPASQREILRAASLDAVVQNHCQPGGTSRNRIRRTDGQSGQLTVRPSTRLACHL